MSKSDSAYTLRAEPAAALQPTDISIRASGFAPGEQVTLASRNIDDVGVEWSAHGAFVADAAGAVDVREAPSEKGTFTGLDPAGLFWSMRPPQGADRSFMINAKETAHKLGQPARDPLKPIKIALTASTGDGVVRASTEIVLHRLDPGVETIQVRDGRLRGVAFRWRDRSRSRGAIMSLTGSGGGVEMGFAPILASIGYDVLSLAYFAYEDLTDTISSIPLEYFSEGFAWMRQAFNAKRCAVQGASRGGELTLLLAAHLPQDVQGAIAIVPMYASSAGWDPKGGVAGPSWTLRGAEIPYAASTHSPSLAEMKRLGEQEKDGFALTPSYGADMNHPEARANAAIPIEHASGPLLLISGVDDQMWPCSWGSDLVIDRLRAKGFKHHFAHLALRETGHITPLPNTVTTFSQAVYHSLADIFLACGGTPEGTARSSRLMWDTMQAHYARIFAD